MIGAIKFFLCLIIAGGMTMKRCLFFLNRHCMERRNVSFGLLPVISDEEPAVVIAYEAR
jgi:hypothetical protein